MGNRIMKKASIIMIIGSLLLLGLFKFPLWNIMLGAPQYPDPLGMNIYIQSGNLYCGFWNINDDGDGSQAFTSVSAPIATNTIYHVTWVFDYTNYAGAAGPDGDLTCYVNGSSIGSTTSTSLLYAHSGAISLGSYLSDSYTHTGNLSGNGGYFNGDVMELMLFNDPPDAATVNTIHTYLEDKWN